MFKFSKTVLGGLVLTLGLLMPASAQALTYVSILQEPVSQEMQAALDRGVDIDVYFTVYNEKTSRNEWRVMRFPNQHSLAKARELINAQLQENKRLPAHKQHQITIGWNRRK